MKIVLLKELSKSIIESLVDGQGIRLVLYVAGCPHKCKSCHNEYSHNINNGISYDIEEVFNYLSNLLDKSEGFFDGITISGGDPIMQDKAVQELLSLLRDKYPMINIWLYTGYIYEKIKDKEVLNYVDVLVDGPFIEKLKGNFKFRGSKNQRIIFLNKS